VKAVGLFALVLLLAGCEHMYGAVDGGRFTPLGAPVASR